jgi:nucleoside-diphosphate-sugar epimerase
VIPELQDAYEVVTLGRSGCDIICDVLEEPGTIRIPESTDVVVHLAASFGEENPDGVIRTVETNEMGTLKVCIAASRAKARHLVLISSVYAGMPESLSGQSLYSVTKRHAEELARFWCRRESLRLTVLRPAPLYGELDLFRRHQPLLYRMADCAEQGMEIPLFGRRDALRNYLYAGDLARIIRKVLERGLDGLHTCTFPQDVPLSEIATAALEAFGHGGSYRFLEDRPDIPDNTFGDSGTLYESMGWFPEVDIREGMRRLADHRRAAHP